MFPVQFDFSKLLHKEWVLTFSKDEALQCHQQQTNKIVILYDKKQYYLTQWNRESMHTSRCQLLPVQTPVEKMIAALEKDVPILVIDETEQPLGLLHHPSLSLTIMQQYRQLATYLQTILHTIDDSCTVIDEQGRVIIWTKGAEKIFSVKAEDILGKPITDFFSSDRLEILNALQQGTSVTHHQHQARKDLVVLINSNPVRLDDQIIGAVVSETDVTNQIRLNNELFSTSEKLFNLEEEMRKTVEEESPFSYIRGNSVALKKTLSLAEKAATTDASILIHGESGVGKELFAKAVHHLRENEQAPFIAINCGAIPSGLFESEIFGYEKGAFSGADQRGKKGKVELAKNGTLFLDEIGEMPLEMQVKILRLLQEKTFFRVGGTTEMEVDFRVVAATNKDLKQLVDEGKFREDLYYRLNVVTLNIPPLRERPEDIIELTHYFLYDLSRRYNKPIHGISQHVMQSLLQHDWPGNIRELKNVVERLIVFSENGEIQADHLPFDIDEQSAEQIQEASPNTSYFINAERDHRPLKERLEEYEKAILIEELKKTNGNKQLCAQNLDITRATLYNRLKRLGIE
ncbi:MAG TPA: sigma 54-interacting transcriptional regulator [Sporosarcina sp.]|nr:sigma 54-interacting transcriptional regulator [Sporosarcina sp.]